MSLYTEYSILILEISHSSPRRNEYPDYRDKLEEEMRLKQERLERERQDRKVAVRKSSLDEFGQLIFVHIGL